MTVAAKMDFPSSKLIWAMRVLCLLALGISGYLAWSAFQQSDVYGCGGGAVWDCGHVLHSRWSKWLGMPVSLPAAGVYSCLLVALAACSPKNRPETQKLGWAIVTVGALSAGIAAFWFVFLQTFVLKKLCVYCMCAHSCGLVLSFIILWRRPLGKSVTSALCGLSSVGAIVLVAGQVFTPPPKTYAEERYDEIGQPSGEGEVFALEGSETDRDPNQLLFAPTDDVMDAPSGESVDQSDEKSVSTSPIAPAKNEPHSVTTANQAPAGRSSIAPSSTFDLDDGSSTDEMAEFVSKYSNLLAEEIGQQLREENSLETSDHLELAAEDVSSHPVDARQREARSIALIGQRLGVKPAAPEEPSIHRNSVPTDATQRDFGRGIAAGGPSSPHPPVARRVHSQQPQLGSSVGRFGSDAARGFPLRLAENSAAKKVTAAKETAAKGTQRTVSPTPAMTPIPESGGGVVKTAKAEPPRESTRNLVAVLGGRAKLDARHWPLLGDTSSKYILVELFDYTCPHCRKMNQHIQAARHRYADLSVMTLPVPLSQECNPTVTHTKARHQASCELSRLAIAVWRVDPEKYETFHEWLFIPEHGRTTGEAWAYASQLVGSGPLQAEMAKPTVNEFIAKHVELYKRAGQGTVPKLMFPRVTIRGEMNSPEALYGILERELFSVK